MEYTAYAVHGPEQQRCACACTSLPAMRPAHSLLSPTCLHTLSRSASFTACVCRKPQPRKPHGQHDNRVTLSAAASKGCQRHEHAVRGDDKALQPASVGGITLPLPALQYIQTPVADESTYEIRCAWDSSQETRMVTSELPLLRRRVHALCASCCRVPYRL